MTQLFTNKDVENDIKKQALSEHNSALSLTAALTVHAIIYGGKAGTVANEAKEAAGFYKVDATKYTDASQLSSARISAVSRPAQTARLVARIAQIDGPVFEYKAVPAYDSQSIAAYRGELVQWLTDIKHDQGLKGERLKEILSRLAKNELVIEAPTKAETEAETKAETEAETEAEVETVDSLRDTLWHCVTELEAAGQSPISDRDWSPESWALLKEALATIEATEIGLQTAAAA